MATLSPVAQSVMDAYWNTPNEPITTQIHQAAVAAALRAAADHVIKELRGNSETENYIDTSVNRLLLLLVRDRFNSIAAELEGSV